MQFTGIFVNHEGKRVKWIFDAASEEELRRHLSEKGWQIEKLDKPLEGVKGWLLFYFIISFVGAILYLAQMPFSPEEAYSDKLLFSIASFFHIWFSWNLLKRKLHAVRNVKRLLMVEMFYYGFLSVAGFFTLLDSFQADAVDLNFVTFVLDVSGSAFAAWFWFSYFLFSNRVRVTFPEEFQGDGALTYRSSWNVVGLVFFCIWFVGVLFEISFGVL